MQKNSGSVLSQKAEDAREQDRHVNALKLLEETLIAYQEEHNYQGFVRALQGRVLTYKHLFYLTDDEIFAILAQKDAEASLLIAEKYNLLGVIGSSYFRLGEVAMLFEDHPKAIEYYQKSLDFYHGTNAERGDFRYHLGEALYRNGKKEEGKKTIFEGLDEIKKYSSEVETWIAHVWESGVHMRLAELLKDDESEEAKKHLEIAQKIANEDEKLIIRRRQIAELVEKWTAPF